MLDQPWIGSIRRIVSSGERKAIETAEILAKHLRLAVEVRERMHENDRSATGFLSPPEFEAVADRFFADPHVSIRGWERAVKVVSWAKSNSRSEPTKAMTSPLSAMEEWERSCCSISADGRSAAKRINRRAAAIISPTISAHDASSTHG